jgi:hypothetical protein
LGCGGGPKVVAPTTMLEPPKEAPKPIGMPTQ